MLTPRRRTPYLPVIDLLRRMCGIPDADDPATIRGKTSQRLHAAGVEAQDAVPLLLELLDAPARQDELSRLEPELRRKNTFAHLIRLSLHCGRERPTVIALEDLHWIDATSAAWVSDLVDRLAGARMLVLATYRPGYQPTWLGRSAATQLALPRLTPGDNATLVDSLPRVGGLPEHVAAAVLAKAQQNPFFLGLLAEIEHVHGNRRQALEGIDEGIALAEETGEATIHRELYRIKGCLLHGGSDEDAMTGEHCWRTALEIAAAQEAKTIELRAAVALGRWLQQRGRGREARALLASIYDWLTEGFETVDLRAAERLRQSLS